jgi:hypothetical protein
MPYNKDKIMPFFRIPVLLKVANEGQPSFDMYYEHEIDAETYQEAYEKAHTHFHAAGGPRKHPHLLDIIEVNKWEPDQLPEC